MQPRHLVDADEPARRDVRSEGGSAGGEGGRGRLRYRDFLTIALVVPEKYSFPDNWIYVHSKDVQVGRIQNFGSWSPYMVKEGRTCLGLEFFVFEGDETWNKPDAELIEQGKRELGHPQPRGSSKVEAGYVVRMPKAYPFYDEHYKANVARIVEWLNDARVERVSGRPQRHAPVQQPGPLDVHGDAHGREHRAGHEHDVWTVNVEEEYHEEGEDGRRRLEAWYARHGA